MSRLVQIEIKRIDGAIDTTLKSVEVGLYTYTHRDRFRGALKLQPVEVALYANEKFEYGTSGVFSEPTGRGAIKLSPTIDIVSGVPYYIQSDRFKLHFYVPDGDNPITLEECLMYTPSEVTI